jgi:hypothetical protein
MPLPMDGLLPNFVSIGLCPSARFLTTLGLALDCLAGGAARILRGLHGLPLLWFEHYLRAGIDLVALP